MKLARNQYKILEENVISGLFSYYKGSLNLIFKHTNTGIARYTYKELTTETTTNRRINTPFIVFYSLAIFRVLVESEQSSGSDR